MFDFELDISGWSATAIQWVQNVNDATAGMLDLFLGIMIAASALILTFKILKSDTSVHVVQDDQSSNVINKK